MQFKHDVRTRAAESRRSIRTLARWSLVVAALAACGDLEPVEPFSPITDPSALFLSLTLDHGAVNLTTAAPYNQLQLTATPRNALGNPMAGLPAPTFRSADTTRVFVTPDGLLQARRTATRVVVTSEIIADGNIRHADTVRVTVTASPTPRMIESFTVEPAAGGDSVWAMVPSTSFRGQVAFLFANGRSFHPGFTVRALDTAGTAISGLSLEYESLDPEIAIVNPEFGSVNGLLQPGHVRVVARTTAYGVSKADTAVFKVTLPIITGYVIRPGANGAPPTVTSQTVTVRPGGYVSWANLTTDSVRVTFDQTDGASPVPEWCTAFAGVHCNGGNIPSFMSPTLSDYKGNTRGRRFMVAGTYTFRLEPLGVNGRVIVTETVQ